MLSKKECLAFVELDGVPLATPLSQLRWWLTFILIGLEERKKALAQKKHSNSPPKRDCIVYNNKKKDNTNPKNDEYV